MRAPPEKSFEERDDEQEQDQRESDDRDALVDLAREGAAADGLDQREEDVAAVERQQRQEVEERERHAHEREDLEVVRQADLQLPLRDADDPDRARELAAPLAREEPADARSPVPVTTPQRSEPADCGRLAGGYGTSFAAGREAEDPAAVAA